MNHIKSRRAARLSLTAGLLVTVLALAQSTDPGRIHENCQSLGINWTKFNCPFFPSQRRCLGLEIAYEASPECETVVRANGTIAFVPQRPDYGALDHYFDGAVNLLDFSGDVDGCFIGCREVPHPGISEDCCDQLCQNTFGGPSVGPGSCPL